jgi:Flp pilus assembly protein TadB
VRVARAQRSRRALVRRLERLELERNPAHGRREGELLLLLLVVVVVVLLLVVVVIVLLVVVVVLLVVLLLPPWPEPG